METHLQEETGKERSSVALPRRSGTNNPLIQAYSQAPWRIATQRGVLFLIVSILGASILWVMVNVTVQAASAGLDIQYLDEKREGLERQIAGQRTDIANQTSAVVMKDRAQKLGFEPINPENITYVAVPGFQGREPVIQASSSSPVDQQPIIKPVYTQSLWEWLLQGILDIGESPSQLLQPGRTAP